ncbi:MAG: DUF2203 family protein [Acidimicrobiia bacterium]
MHEWTPERANAALAEVRERVERVIALLDAARRERHPVHEDDHRAPATNGRQHLEPAEESARTALVGLEAEGILLRDLDRGIVDFHAVAPSGRTYCLSWVVGEPEVAWWYWPETGFDGRTPLTEPPA